MAGIGPGMKYSKERKCSTTHLTSRKKGIWEFNSFLSFLCFLDTAKICLHFPATAWSVAGMVKDTKFTQLHKLINNLPWNTAVCFIYLKKPEKKL